MAALLVACADFGAPGESDCYTNADGEWVCECMVAAAPDTPDPVVDGVPAGDDTDAGGSELDAGEDDAGTDDPTRPGDVASDPDEDPRASMDGTEWQCDEGQYCNAEPGKRVGLCDCSETKCHGRYECRKRMCVGPLECGNEVPCLDGGVCDVLHNRCKPADGSCRSVGDCPTFAAIEDSAIECTSDYCRVVASAAEAPPWLAGEAREPNRAVQVQSPDPQGASYFEGWGDVHFRWSSSALPVLATVLRDRAQDATQYHELAVWSASVPAGKRQVSFDEGFVIPAEGDFAPATQAAPEPGAYYFSAIAVRPSGIVMVSPLVPFSVGRPWPQELDACEQAIDCTHPTAVMTCHERHCRLVCASAADCRDSKLPAACGPLTGGRRFCGTDLR